MSNNISILSMLVEIDTTIDYFSDSMSCKENMVTLSLLINFNKFKCLTVILSIYELYA